MSTCSYICSCCGKDFSGFPFSFAADFPDSYANLSREERELRAIIGSDQCIIDREQFYIRGCIELPICNADGIFLWGVWAMVNESVFDEISDHWETEGREGILGPYKGRLANELSIYPGTLNGRLEIRIMPVGTRPRFLLEDADLTITCEQKEGITAEKAVEYSCLLLRIARSKLISE